MPSHWIGVMSASPWSRSATWRDDVHDEGPRLYDSDDEDTDQSAVQDVGESFDNLVVDHNRPIRICLWRREETAIRHRNPLSCPALHSSIRTMVVDSLHCWYLLSAIPRARLVANRGPQRARSRLAQSGEAANSVQKTRSLLPQLTECGMNSSH